jgi:hypothetical protein
MKQGENIVVIVDRDIKGAEVIEVRPDGMVVTSIKTYYGDNTEFPRNKVFTASEWEQVKGEFLS